MEQREREIDPAGLPARLDELDGIERLRAAARASGSRAYLVGGSVRDLLLGEGRLDLDVAVEGSPLGLAEALGGELLSHQRFATATVRVDDHVIDLAATRAESYARPGALPEVRPASLPADLARRDFTVNAMALPLLGRAELIDPHGGLDDLRTGILRDLHEGSFIDDPTRVLRAARYGARLGLAPEPGTLDRIRAADLGAVSADRVEAELRKLACEDEAASGFGLLSAWGLIDLPPRATEEIAAIVDLGGRPPWAELDHRADAVLAVATGAGEGADRLAGEQPATPSAGARTAHGFAPHELLVARARGAEWLDDYVATWRHVRLEISGRDLLDAGIPEGPRIGRGLAEALEGKLDGEVAGREEELRAALAAAGE